MPNNSVMVISDTHFPYAHPDTIEFLKTVKQHYKPDKVIHIGDEIDGHAISMHDHSPDLMSPSDEFQAAIDKLKALYKIFPKVDVVESNHGSLVYRRGSKYGLPRHVLKSYREILGAPKTWKWHFDITMKCGGHDVYFCHGKNTNSLRLSQSMGMSTVNGHYHEQFCIQYWSSPKSLNWAMVVGCLIDKKSLAFAYGRNNLKRPILGCGMIVQGHPLLIPMVLTNKGRWIGRLI